MQSFKFLIKWQSGRRPWKKCRCFPLQRMSINSATPFPLIASTSYPKATVSHLLNFKSPLFLSPASFPPYLKTASFKRWRHKQHQTYTGERAQIWAMEYRKGWRKYQKYVSFHITDKGIFVTHNTVICWGTFRKNAEKNLKIW